MQLLLDTHTFIWFTENDEKLSKQAAREIIDGRNNCFLSIASIWEMAIKISAGKLKLKVPFNNIANIIIENNISVLPIEFNHLKVLIGLDFFHRDPFDRVIIAQAISENLVVVTTDAHFTSYPVKSLW